MRNVVLFAQPTKCWPQGLFFLVGRCSRSCVGKAPHSKALSALVLGAGGMVVDWVVYATAMGTLAIVFVISVSHKLRDFGRFKASLGAYRLAPEFLLPVVAPALVILELVAIAAIVVPGGPGALIAIALLAVYTLAIMINLLRGNTSIDCGCGDTPTPISGWLVLRNSLLLLLVLPQQPANGSLDAVMWVLVAALVIIFALFYLIVEQLLANHHLLIEDAH